MSRALMGLLFSMDQIQLNIYTRFGAQKNSCGPQKEKVKLFFIPLLVKKTL